MHEQVGLGGELESLRLVNRAAPSADTRKLFIRRGQVLGLDAEASHRGWASSSTNGLDEHIV